MGVNLEALGSSIAAARKRLGLTQVELGELAGVSYRPVYLIERGRSIRLDTLIRLCDVLGLEVRVESRGGMTVDRS